MQSLTTRSNRLTQLLLAVLAIGVWGLLLKPELPINSVKAGVLPDVRPTTFDVLNVHRINIVDPDGKTRLVISDSARFPGTIIHGKSHPRSIHNAAGVLFYNTKGDETGGVALAKLRDLDMNNITFDCTYQATDCIRMIKAESPDGKWWRTAFEIFDRRPYQPGPPTSSQGIERIALSDENRNAQLVISDAHGRPRIRIGVDKSGTPIIEMLNAAGRVTYRAGTAQSVAR